MTPEDIRNIEECKSIDGATWLEIHAWGRKSGKLQRWQDGIAKSLAELAALGWTKGPSIKQARQGVKIIDLAREAGIAINSRQ